MIRSKFHVAVVALLAVSGAAMAGEPAKTGDPAAKPVTFTKDIAPIFQEKCEACHRKDSMAPMSLVTYEETRPWARSIKERVVTHQMPPWHLDKTVGIQQFQNDRSLSDEQVAMIARWVDAGAPMGNPKDMPPPKQFPNEDEWQLARQYGQPDLVIKSEPYTMPAVNQDQWWRPMTDIPITEERWVRAVEMRPATKGGRRITHHAIAYLIQTEPKTQSAVSDDPLTALAGGGILMEWAVGKQYDIYRPDTGKLLLPGAKVWWDIHLHAVGDEIRDHVELAVYLYPKGEKPKYRTYLTMFNAASSNAGSPLDIPPNTVAETQGYHVLKQAARLENFQPHMHLRGKAMLLEAVLPDGTVQTLSYCNNFNFNWMNNYIYAEEAAPVLPKGTIIHVSAWHDNTTAKASNPDPNQWVGWGDRTVDEMAHAWVNVTYISDEDYNAWLTKHPRKPRSLFSLNN
ncbi:MAG TPA: cytochrome c [Bryobacteraceae bacterium]|nr:cytochrome c [Bryobacteraceae bacterium]